MDETKNEQIEATGCNCGGEGKCLRRRDWAITLWEHLEHFEGLEKKLSRYVYVGQFETAPKTGLVHGHFFIQTPARNPIARHTLDDLFSGGHFEIVRSPVDYFAYCQKDDTVVLDDAGEPKRFRNGDLKLVGGSGSDKETVLDGFWLQMVNGVPLNTLLKNDPKALRYIEKLERLERRLFGEQQWEQHLKRLERPGKDRS